MNVTGIFYGVDWEFFYGCIAIILILFFSYLIIETRLKEHYVKVEQIKDEVKNE